MQPPLSLPFRFPATVVAVALSATAWVAVSPSLRAQQEQPSKKPAAVAADQTTTAMNNPTNATTDQKSPSSLKPSREEIKKRLTPEQFRVTCEAGTEPPFRNAYWNEHRPGIYVDIITGEPLFTSLDKFDSGTGWPSFTKPLAKDNVIEHTDRTFGMERTEVRSKSSDAHLGHVFDDGPTDKGGMRYCMNSASLRFVPVEKLEAEGYGKYKALFEAKK